MPKGKAGPKPPVLDEPLEAQAPLEEQQPETREPMPPQEFSCLENGCKFSGTFEEWTEHSSATGHADFSQQDRAPEEPEQPALFETDGIVKRYVNVAVTEDWLNEARCNMERVVRQILSIEDEKKAFDADANERLKPLKEQLRGLDKTLQRTTEQREVDCEWRVSTEQNSRILVRLDTGETMETKALTAEDFAKMQDEANKANAAQVNAARQDAEATTA
jgi:hypothetical protein